MKTKRKKKPLVNRITFRMDDDMVEFLEKCASRKGLVDISDLLRMTVHDLMVREEPEKYGSQGE